ncbi:metallophosphoesterase [Gloeocapsa sp. PCC 73106]|uniref:metallophosphoesterase family protein n=1 Tax=Gloeocapsa sp. PCC 73106 TaxID=102232 RepID=UPI0002ACD0D9|nr:metallophosphoesterase [Gloeocapsa sp. PCC 73106]ELR99187.1 putative phosphohydrolase [Gloeocapsa sp. PCC 73106]
MYWRRFLSLVILSFLLSASVPLYNPPRGDVRIVVISDLNSAYGSTTYDLEVTQAIALIPFWRPDLVLCGGDMIAGQSLQLTDAQVTAMWQAFDDHVAKPLRDGNYPFGFTVGNHDASSAITPTGEYIFSRERNLASEYWQNRQQDLGLDFLDFSEFPFYYTFQYRDIFFLVWDGSSHYIPPAQLAWVERSLGSTPAQSAKMRVVIGHLPIYGVAVGRDRPGEVMANAEFLRALLEQYRVHTYISGHQHAYYPAHKGTLQLLHSGAIGSGPRSLISGNLPPVKTITLIDINFNSSELTTYTTYNMNTLELIENSQLPPFLDSHNGRIWRRDILQSHG